MRAEGIGAAGVGAVVGAALGFHVTSGLIALITTIIGAAVVSNLSLLVLDIWTERAAGAAMATTPPQPTVARRTPDRVEGLDHDLVVVGRVERGAP
jgi:hypothetical protein